MTGPNTMTASRAMSRIELDRCGDALVDARAEMVTVGNVHGGSEGYSASGVNGNGRRGRHRAEVSAE